MAESFLISLPLSGSAFNENRGISTETLSYLKRVLIHPSSSEKQAALDFVRRNRNCLLIYVDCSSLANFADIVELLDEGCGKILVTESQSATLIREGYLETDNEDRLVVKDGSVVKSPRYVLVERNIADEYPKVVKNGAVAVIPANKLTASSSKFPDLYPIHRLVTSIIRSDRPDGLYPTIVADQRGICLGLVYSSDESIERALETGRGVYYSRSRNKLWIKGEESGDIQELIDISWDCDSDTIQFRVNQSGVGKY